MGARLTRRTFIKALSGASSALIAGLGGLDGAWIASARAAPPPPADFPAVDGELLWDDASLGPLSTDNGQYVRRRPRAVLRPGSVEDLVRIVRFANVNRLKVAVRGQGHSQYGHALVEDGVAIDSRSFNAVRLSDAEIVEIQSGATWNDVIKVTLAAGLTPPALGNTMTLSVGGILSVGGWSSRSQTVGSIADAVRELDVVTGDGRLVTCSREKSPDLFDVALAGMGQCAIIARARMRLERAPKCVVRRALTYDRLPDFLHDMRSLSAPGKVDHLSADVIRGERGWTYRFEVGKFCDSPDEVPDGSLEAGLGFTSREARVTSYFDYLQREAASNAAARERARLNPVRRAFIAMFLPATQAEPFLERVLATPAETAGVFRMAPVIFDTRHFHRPMFKLPAENPALVLWIFRTAPADDRDAFTRLAESNFAMLERMRAIGGKAYPPYAPYSVPSQWQEHYGAETWRRLVAAKNAYDPNNVLAPGSGMFASA